MRLLNQPFKSFPKPERKPKKTAKENWDAMKRRTFETMKKKNAPLWDADEKFLKELWDSREHFCNECGADLGNDYKKIFCDHILPKKDFASLRYEEANIQFLCRAHHSNKHGSNVSEFQKKVIADAKKYFDV